MTELDRYEQAVKERTFSKPGRRKLRQSPTVAWLRTPNGWRLWEAQERVKDKKKKKKDEEENDA